MPGNQAPVVSFRSRDATGLYAEDAFGMRAGGFSSLNCPRSLR
jgi:hypothetical protein